jgi:hypothetical protein
MATQNRKVRSGNTVQILLDGSKIGTMKSVRMNDDYSPDPVTGIGDIHVQEWVPTVARHRLQCQYVVLNRGALRELGIAAINGDDMLRGLVFDIVSVSKIDGSIIRKYNGCSYASGDVEITANAVVMASAEFNALDASGVGG